MCWPELVVIFLSQCQSVFDLWLWSIFIRVDEEGVAKFTLQKQLREMQNQLQEVVEDLETEREAKAKAEKQKKDLNEVYCTYWKAV